MRSSNFAFEEFSSFKNPEGFAFPETWRVAGVEVYIVESLCRFKVRAHIKNRVLFESVALLYTCIQECYFIICNLSRELYCRMEAIC